MFISSPACEVAMARIIRPLRQWPLFQHTCCASQSTFHRLLSSSLLLSSKSSSNSLALSTICFSIRDLHSRTPGRKFNDAPAPVDVEEERNSDSDSDSKKSRNQKKREAKRAFLWGMELSSFTASQIKRIIKVASLEREVYEALMLVKRLGHDVREGKRRQYNYIGKLLRDVQPELMDVLILATKDGDWSRLQAVPGFDMGIIDDDDAESEETEPEDEEEGSHEYVERANRWLDGLINKDIEITNEVYAVRSVEFDRQELRKLVRRVHSALEDKVTEENEQETDPAIVAAKKPLSRFLHSLAKQMPSESTETHRESLQQAETSYTQAL
ncbi:uncharacterized protein [Euphorbia lathyris]|uniref:uncharacterized protein n=1 Tax=Euphorbia lathyris TaxID=212925 RepID=UPI00331322A4